MKKVVITDSDLGGSDIEQIALGPNYVVELIQSTNTATIVEKAQDAVAILVQRAKISEELMEALPELRVVVRYGMGVDNVDSIAATKLGIKISGVSDYCVREVTEHTAMFVAAASRQLWRYQESVNAGGWGRGDQTLPRVPEDDPVGIVGFGTIGRSVAERLHLVGHPIFIFDPNVDPSSIPDPFTFSSSLESLAKEVAHLTLHSPLTGQTRGMISESILALLGPDGHLVNTSRGGLVDEDALVKALDHGLLGHASLDVLSEEPPSSSMERLIAHHRTTITPHIAYLSRRSLASLRKHAADTVRFLLEEAEHRIVVNGNNSEEGFS